MDTNDRPLVAVFCGARTGNDPAFADAARHAAAAIARRGMGVVFGGGRVGLMGIVADTAIQHNAPVVGVIPRSMVEAELAHTGCTELHIVESMHERKAMMAHRAAAFLALPGGVGTLDEVFEAITWNQLAIHDKPIGFLDTDGFYKPLRTFLEHANHAGLIPDATMSRLAFHAAAEALIDALLPSHAEP